MGQGVGAEVPSFKPRFGKGNRFIIFDLLFGICLKFRIWDLGFLGPLLPAELADTRGQGGLL